MIFERQRSLLVACPCHRVYRCPMSREVLIAPSILGANLGRLEQELAVVEEAGADYIHVDVMDGHFVPNITWGPPLVRAVRGLTQLPLDVHLMIEEPARYIKDFADAGADIIGFHIEADRHAHRTLGLIRSLGKKACITLNPQTPISAIEYLLSGVDQVLLMSVNPGFGGQSFIPEVTSKIEALAERREAKGLHFHIQVDGGINVETARLVALAGADVLVAGAAIFGSADAAGQVHAIRTAALSAPPLKL